MAARLYRTARLGKVRAKGWAMDRDKDKQAESRRIIRRIGAETDGSMMQRAQDHMAGRDADEKDWAELWGTRIGRWLGLALVLYLIWWLIRFMMAGG